MKLLALLLVLATSSSGQDDPAFKQPATVRAHFLLPDGTPAEGVSLRLRGYEGDTQRLRQFGAPKEWTDPVARTDAEGRAELRFVPPRAYSFLLQVELEGYATSAWNWSEIRLGETIDLGTVSLDAAGTIVGTVVDGRGNVLTRRWYAYAAPKARYERGRNYFGQTAAVDPDSGEFRLEGVPAGAVAVRARGLGVSTEPVEVEVVAGLETLVEIVYDGPDLERRVEVRIRTPFSTVLDASAVRLVSSDGESRVSGPEGSSRSLVFDGVPEGTYRVEIVEPHYERWVQEGVRPGESVTANLRPAGRLALDVVYAETGRAVPHYGVGVILDEHSRERELVPDGTPAPEDGIITGVMPLMQTLVVRVPDRPVQRVVLDGAWTRGEAREVRVEVAAGREQRGRVLDGSGRALTGVRIERTAGVLVGTPLDNRALGADGTLLPTLEQTWETDSAGEFAFDGVGAGTHTFLAICSPWLTATATVELPLASGEELALEVPESGRLRGRLLLPDTVSADTLALDFSGALVDSADWLERRRLAPRGGIDSIWGRIASDGTFDVGPLPAGELTVERRRRVTMRGRYEAVERRSLATVTIRPGESTSVEWDLRSEITGSARLRLRIDGAPAGVGRVLATHAQTNKWTGGHPPADDPGGVYVFEDLAPGGWFVGLVGPERSWQWSSDEPFHVEAARETALELDLQLHRRSARILDAETGAPLAGVDVVAWTGPRGWRSGRTRGTSDDSGVFELVLPPGEVRFCVATESDTEADDSVAVEWGEGEDVIEVRLPGSER